MKCEEAQDLITAFVDGEISDSERTSIEVHLKDCGICRLAYRREQDLKKELRAAGARVVPPAAFREKLLANLHAHEADRALQISRVGLWRRELLRPAIALAASVLLILPALYFFPLAGKPVSLVAIGTHQKILRGDLPFTRAASAREIRVLLADAVRGKFAPMEYDLSRIHLSAVGARIEKIRGREILVTVYEGGGPSLTCYTLLGTEEDAPPNARVFFDPEKRINFYIFSEHDVNGVLHQEGELICILVSKMPAENLLEIARANARPT
jgi:anti-sigma factor RsiW